MVLLFGELAGNGLPSGRGGCSARAGSVCSMLVLILGRHGIVLTVGSHLDGSGWSEGTKIFKTVLSQHQLANLREILDISRPPPLPMPQP